MEIEDSFGFSKKRSENSNSLKREFQRFRNENSRANFAPDPEEVGELVSDGDSIHDEIPLFPQEVKTGPEKKIPDPISLDVVKKGSAHKVLIKDVEVYFPYKPYDVQIAYMESVIDALNGQKNALLQSPTGTGKTLCLLCATLAWLCKYRNKFIRNPSEMKDYKPIKIYYSSRTHSQIKQVLKELKQTCYRPITALLGSRDQMCVKSDFAGLSGNQLNAACKAARTVHIAEQRCSFYDGYNKNKNVHLTRNKKQLYDIEELVALGKKDRLCPYFFERDVKDKGDLILLPYNYLMDGRMRDAMKLDIYHSILIFDEAHNIEKLSEDGCSFTLSMRDLENCEGDFKLLRQRVKQGEDCKITDDDIDLLEFPIQSLAKSMTAMKKEMDREKRQNKYYDEGSKGKVEAGRNFFRMFKEMTKETSNSKSFKKNPVINKFKDGIDINNFPEFLVLLSRNIDELSTAPLSKGGLEHLAFCATTTFNLLQTDAHIRETGTTAKDLSRNFINSYILQTHYGDEEEPVFSISLWCLHPGVGFEFIKSREPRNVLLTSGTLAPLKSFESELTLEFPIKLENGHVIDTKAQCYTAIVKKGLGGHSLNFSYQNRDDTSSYREMGTTLLNIAKLVPNGVLVCFASYFLMNKCIDIWESMEDNMYEKINKIKPIYKEPKRSSQLGAIMQKYKADATTKGAILFCVCRGKVSEGIDFADEMARAVVIIGIPFPALGDMRVSEKKKFLDENKTITKRISGGEWYMQQTVRAVNQVTFYSFVLLKRKAIGRVIRSIKDYGVVFLCDERFGRTDFSNEFPRWIRDNMETVDKFGFLIGKVMTFFRNKKTAPPLGNLIREEKKESITFKQRQEMFINEETVRDEPENIAPETSITMPRNFVPVFEEEEEKSPTFYYSQQQQQPSSQYRPIRFISFASPNRENGVNAFDYFREKRILSDLKNQTNTLNIADPREDVVEENQAHNVPSLRELKANSSNPSVQKAKKVKLTPVEKNTQNSLTSFGFKVSPSQNLTPSLQYQPQSQSQIQYLQPQSQPIQQRMPQSQPSRQNITFVSLIDEQDDYPQIVNVSENIPETRSVATASLKSFVADTLKGSQNDMSSQNDLGSKRQPSSGGGVGAGVTCFMCYEGGENKKMMTSPCGHIACKECWNKWLEQKAECPQCRAKVRAKRLITLHI